MARILIIEDETALRVAIGQSLTRVGHMVVAAADLAAAITAFHQAEPDLVLTDVGLPDGSGIDIVRQIRSEGFEGVAVAITAFGTIEKAVASMKEGADDFLQKPLKLDAFPAQVEKWLAHGRATRRLRLYERLEQARDGSEAVLGRSPDWESTLRLARRLAAVPLDAPSEHGGVTLPAVLLLGETGTGKGVLARYIHSVATQGASAAAPGGAPGDAPPFVHVNCSALPATLVEAELFGHERGAFTDARDARPGLFELADGGTIFLDEIGDMPLELQAKLLLVVEQGRFRRVGGTKDRTVRVRVIAASNTDLAARVAEGRFRQDLLYRLNALTIRIPSLREREGDAVLIAEETLGRLAARYGRPCPRLGDAARAAIAAHEWKGNVRELVNTMQRVAMLCDGDTVQPHHLGLAEDERANASQPSHGRIRSEGGLPVFDFSQGVHSADEIERTLLEQALRHTDGNVSRAARLVGLTRASMRYRMERHKISDLHAGVNGQ